MDGAQVNKKTASMYRWRANHREEYLAQKKKYNERHREQRKAYRQRKKAELVSQRT